MVRKSRTTVVIKAKKKKAGKMPVTQKEVSALGKAIRTLGMAAGGAAGGYFGQPAAGVAVGHSLGAALSRWLGAGDYSIGSNTIVRQSMKAAGSIPAMHTDQQSVIIRHKEYLGEVLSSDVFSVQQSFPLNPGIALTFPWASGIAGNFQEYRIRGLVFHYIPSSGAAISSTDASLGTVMLQTSYRSNDTPPTSKVELLNEFWSNEVVPCDTMAHPVECDPKENPFNVQYVRTSSVPSGDSVLMYDLGQTHLAVSGCQTVGKRLGDLWVTYDIELKKPLLYSNVTSRVESASGIVSSPSSTSQWLSPGKTLTGTIAVAITNNTVTFPKGTVGTFMVLIEVGGSNLTLTNSGVTPTNGTLVPAVAGLATTVFNNLAGTTIVDVWLAVQIVDPQLTCVLTYGMGGGATTLTQTRVIVTQIA